MTAPAPVAFDARPLTEPVDRAAVKEFARELRSQGKAPAGMGVVAIVAFVVIGVFMLGVFGSIFTALGGLILSGGGFASLFVVAPFLFIGGIITVVLVAIIRGSGGGGSAGTGWTVSRARTA
ncbi:hypothetical protein [Microbacterium lushaniae]|uniref:hypothetical protein n=1 Tax=Microbacterium lushaniae TaxID=2614639 RepID=UPI003083F594